MPYISKRKRHIMNEQEIVEANAFMDLVRQRRADQREKMKSKCLEGRLRHTFRSPKTRSLTPDLKCWWCKKTVAQVKEERKSKKKEGGIMMTVQYFPKVKKKSAKTLKQFHNNPEPYDAREVYPDGL